MATTQPNPKEEQNLDEPPDELITGQLRCILMHLGEEREYESIRVAATEALELWDKRQESYTCEGCNREFDYYGRYRPHFDQCEARDR